MPKLQLGLDENREEMRAGAEGNAKQFRGVYAPADYRHYEEDAI